MIASLSLLAGLVLFGTHYLPVEKARSVFIAAVVLGVTYTM